MQEKPHLSKKQLWRFYILQEIQKSFRLGAYSLTSFPTKIFVKNLVPFEIII